MSELVEVPTLRLRFATGSAGAWPFLAASTCLSTGALVSRGSAPIRPLDHGAQPLPPMLQG